jgi:hypothetical protein
MIAGPTAWPLCPRPQADESLLSWFERVAHEYDMSPTLLMSVVRQDGASQSFDALPLVDRLYESEVADRISILARLTQTERRGLWPPMTGWDLKTRAYCAFCPYCCMEDLRHDRTPYGRQSWQQSWYTICRGHGIALVGRNLAQVPANGSYWSTVQLRGVADYGHTDQYSCYKGRSDPAVRSNILACLVEIERSTAEALAGITPNLFLWGKLTAEEFLVVLSDLTTWSLTHFAPVRCWSAAEELTASEIQEGHGLLGRTARISGTADGKQRSTRSLSDVASPKVRGAALWAAHALMATHHTATSDRPSGKRPQDRQQARLSRAAPASRRWLAQRQAHWPRDYCRSRWIEVEALHANC